MVWDKPLSMLCPRLVSQEAHRQAPQALVLPSDTRWSQTPSLIWTASAFCTFLFPKAVSHYYSFSLLLPLLLVICFLITSVLILCGMSDFLIEYRDIPQGCPLVNQMLAHHPGHWHGSGRICLWSHRRLVSSRAVPPVPQKLTIPINLLCSFMLNSFLKPR